MNPEMRQEIIQNIKKLPTLPVIFEKILETIDDPRSSATILQDTIKNDQSITAKVLNMANSAYYGYSKTVSDLSRAIVILGFDMVKNIALSVSVFGMFPHDEESHFDREQFWLHSIACGYLGKIIADTAQYLEPDKAFISCLLHDIGKVVFDNFFEDEYQKVIALMTRDNISIREAEEKIINVNHSEVGYILGEKWNFPEELLSAIKYHHTPEVAPLRHNQLTYITYLTNIISQQEKVGAGGSVLPLEIDDRALSVLKLKNSQIEKIREELRAMREKLEVLIQIMH